MKKTLNLIIDNFFIFLLLYFILQIIIRLFVSTTATIDESEQLMLSQYFDFGYNTQPPLYTWIQMIVFKVFGTNIFSLSIFKNLLLFLTYIYVYKIGLLIYNDKIKSVLSTVSLMLLPQIIWAAQIDQAHTILVTLASALTIYYFLKIALHNPRVFDFVLIGFATGVGFLSKYSFILVVFGLGVSLFFIKDVREKFLTKHILISLCVFIAMILPHYIWFLSHIDIATTRIIDRMKISDDSDIFIKNLYGIWQLIVAHVGFIAPFLLIFILIFKKNIYFYKSTITKILSLFLISIFITLLGIVVFTGASHIKSRWLQPILFIFPTLMFLHTVNIQKKQIYKYLKICLFVSIIVALMIIIRPYLIDIKNKPSRHNYPFKILSQTLNPMLSKHNINLIYVQDKFIGGNLRLFFPHATYITKSLPTQSYKQSNSIAFFYTKNKPDFQKKILSNSFTCKINKTLHIPFMHSNKKEYTIHFDICTKKSKES